MKYLVSYYYKNDLEKRYKGFYDSMQMAIAFANMLIAQGDYVIDSIQTEYSNELQETKNRV